MANDGSEEASFPKQRPKDIKKDSVPPTICTSCNEDILDKYYMKVDDRCWHESKLEMICISQLSGIIVCCGYSWHNPNTVRLLYKLKQFSFNVPVAWDVILF